jgi:hypothetical protein
MGEVGIFSSLALDIDNGRNEDQRVAFCRFDGILYHQGVFVVSIVLMSSRLLRQG